MEILGFEPAQVWLRDQRANTIHHSVSIQRLCSISITKLFFHTWLTFLARLYKVYGELSYSPRRRRPRPDFRLKFWCSKIFVNITLSFLKVSTSNFKYMFLIINHILCDKVHNSSTNIFTFISPWT
jgi:hypothetical protein